MRCYRCNHNNIKIVIVNDDSHIICDKCHHKTIGHENEYINHFIGDLCGKRL